MTREENELIRSAQGGSVKAFEELVYRYDQRVFRTALRFTHNTDLAQDVYQEVFLKVHRNLRRFRFESQFSTWLYRIVANVSLTHISRGRGAHHLPIEAPEETGPDGIHPSLEPGNGYSDPGRRVLGNEIRSRIDKALLDLSPQQRTVFVLRHFEGCKLKDIAAILECAEGTVKKHLFNATLRMREQLKELRS